MRLDTRKWLSWTMLSVFIRGLVLAYFVYVSNTIHDEKMVHNVALVGNDYNYILRPVDNFYNAGTYTLEPGAPGYFAGRMPGYSLPYLFIRAVFNQSNSLFLLAVAQFLLSALCVYVLALTAKMITGSKKVFLLVFFLFAVSTFTAVFDFMVGFAESFSVSALILFLYFFVRYQYSFSRRDLLLAGAFLGWAIFLRPFLGILIALVPFLIFLAQYKSSFKKAVINACIFVSPFLLFDLAWITNNYIHLKQFIPLEQSTGNVYGTTYSPGWIAIRHLISDWGGEGAYFEYGSEAWWFREDLDKGNVVTYTFNDRIFRNVPYTRDSLIRLRDLYQQYHANGSTLSVDEPGMKELDDRIVAMANRFDEQYTSGNPLNYLFFKYAKAVKRMVFKSGSSYLTLPPFAHMSLFQKALKIGYSLLYYLVLLLGIIGLISLVRSKDKTQRNIALLLLLIPLNLVATLIFFSDIQESRYFLTAYPILLLGACIFLSRFFPDSFIKNPD